MASSSLPTGRAFADEGAAAAWRKAGPGRSAYLAISTARLFDFAALSPGARVLVVGGGTGDEAIEVARAVGADGEVVQTDLSAEMVKEARRALAESGFPKVRCLVMDAQRLDFPDGSFDAVVARNVLMFIPDLRRALGEMRRVLRPGARLAGTTWAGRARNPRLAIPPAAARTLGVKVPPDMTLSLALRLSRPERLRGALLAAGFSEVRVERAAATARPSDWGALLADLRHHVGTREIARLIPDQSQDRFWRSVDRRFNRHRASGSLDGEQLVIGGTA